MCALTIIVNLSTEMWNKADQEALDGVKSNCSKYYEDSPCLKEFIKKEPGVYNVICGKPK